MANLYQALGGGQPSADQQPSAPVPPASAGVGAGSPQLPGMFQALQQQQAQQNPQGLAMGPMIASNDPIPTEVSDAMKRQFKTPSAPPPAPTGDSTQVVSQGISNTDALKSMWKDLTK